MDEEVSNYTNFNNSDFNVSQLDVWDLLARVMGPQRLSLEFCIPLTILNVLILITGVFGNVCVCLVIVKHSNLHTITNYYLFNLAISDLTLLVFGLPFEVALYWQQYPWVLGNNFCKFRALVSEWSSYVSVLTIVAFSTERYFSICYPLYLYKMGGLHRAIKIISAIWFISFFAALPFSMFTEVNYYALHNHYKIKESAFCGMIEQPPIPLSLLSFIIFFLVPMAIIVMEYSMMGYKIAHRTNLILGTNRSINNVHRDRTKTQSHRAIVRMLAVVVFAFFICWAPFHAQRLNYEYGRDSQYFAIINQWMYFITGILYYFSSTINPILYNVMSHRYRTAFQEEILCGKDSSPNNHSIVRNSTIRETRITTNSGGGLAERNFRQFNSLDATLEDESSTRNLDAMFEKESLICELNYQVDMTNIETSI